MPPEGGRGASPSGTDDTVSVSEDSSDLAPEDEIRLGSGCADSLPACDLDALRKIVETLLLDTGRLACMSVFEHWEWALGLPA